MNLKLPLNGCIYTLTISDPNHQHVSDQSRPAFVQSHSQSQTMLTFVTALEMDNFDCTKINAHFKNSQLVCGMGYKWKHTLLAPPFPLYAGKQLMALFHVQLLLTYLVFSVLCTAMQHCCTIDILPILVKAQPSTPSTWPLSL